MNRDSLHIPATQRTRRAAVLLPALMAMLAVLTSGSSAWAEIGTISVTGGQISGTIENGVSVYKGIPFAEPPVGELRWVEPQPVRSVEGPRTRLRLLQREHREPVRVPAATLVELRDAAEPRRIRSDHRAERVDREPGAIHRFSDAQRTHGVRKHHAIKLAPDGFEIDNNAGHLHASTGRSHTTADEHQTKKHQTQTVGPQIEIVSRKSGGGANRNDLKSDVTHQSLAEAAVGEDIHSNDRAGGQQRDVEAELAVVGNSVYIAAQHPGMQRKVHTCQEHEDDDDPMDEGAGEIGDGLGVR